ncbi:hypothetical protein [Streptomyces sp. NPDC089919]|uniref:hypothetical protein n=1 Tax=Streptomyces sp. NPDC089919 TaxID=3155188 RepID=UPI00341497EA
MSQQGDADDWWRNLYEDFPPDSSPPSGESLDAHFHAASHLSAPPAAPPAPGVPPARPEPAAGPPAPDPHQAGGLPPRPRAPWEAPPGAPPGAPPEAGSPPVPPSGPAEPPPTVVDLAVPAPGAEAGPPAGPEPAVPPPPEAPPAAPGDGRLAGETSQGQGHAPGLPAQRSGPPPVLPPVPPPGAAGGPEGTVAGPPAVPPPPAEPPAPPAGAAPGHPHRPVVPGHPHRPVVRYLGDRPPTYEGEPGVLPRTDPAGLEALVHDTVLEGARYGRYTLRAASVRGDSARYRGEVRRDCLLTARFGGGDNALVLIAVAGGDRAVPGAPQADAELCRWIAGAIGRSQERLGDDIRAGRRDDLRSGLQRLTDRAYGRLRSQEYPEPTGLRCLLLPIDPECHTRIAFGTGEGGAFRLRGGAWEDLEDGRAEGSFRFRASLARPGDTLLVCSAGLAEPMREEPLLPEALSGRWGPAAGGPPGLATFLADTQLRVKGYADDRTAAAVWEA